MHLLDLVRELGHLAFGKQLRMQHLFLVLLCLLQLMDLPLERFDFRLAVHHLPSQHLILGLGLGESGVVFALLVEAEERVEVELERPRAALGRELGAELGPHVEAVPVGRVAAVEVPDARGFARILRLWRIRARDRRGPPTHDETARATGGRSSVTESTPGWPKKRMTGSCVQSQKLQPYTAWQPGCEREKIWGGAQL